MIDIYVVFWHQIHSEIEKITGKRENNFMSIKSSEKREGGGRGSNLHVYSLHSTHEAYQ